jgi:hypothetical protein
MMIMESIRMVELAFMGWCTRLKKNDLIFFFVCPFARWCCGHCEGGSSARGRPAGEKR